MKFLLSICLLLNISYHSALAQQGDNLEQNFDNTAQGLGGDGTKLQKLSPEEFGNAKKEAKPALKESFVSGMMSGVMKQAINQFLKENPFSKMDRDEVKSMIQVKTNGLPVAKLFEKNPKILDMLVDWIRDEKALPKIMSIVNKPDQVKKYGIIVTAIFILSFILNLTNSKGGLGKRILKKMGIFFGAFIVNITAFVVLFKEEITPTLDIVFRYFHI